MGSELQAAIAGSEQVQFFVGQSGSPNLASCVDRSLHFQKQGLHLPSPSLTHHLLDKGQVAQVVDITQGLKAVVALVTGPSVMHTHSCEPWQDADVIQRFATSLETLNTFDI